MRRSSAKFWMARNPRAAISCCSTRQPHWWPQAKFPRWERQFRWLPRHWIPAPLARSWKGLSSLLTLTSSGDFVIGGKRRSLHRSLLALTLFADDFVALDRLSQQVLVEPV